MALQPSIVRRRSPARGIDAKLAVSGDDERDGVPLTNLDQPLFDE